LRIIADKYIGLFTQAYLLNPIKIKDGITMTKKLQKMAVAAAILGLGAIAVKSAEAASVKLTFFEDADTPAVGVGSFSYDESTPYEAIFESSFFGTSIEINASDKFFVVQDFAVN
jgi:hypothetical protein